jgi:hypothetical protein
MQTFKAWKYQWWKQQGWKHQDEHYISNQPGNHSVWLLLSMETRDSNTLPTVLIEDFHGVNYASTTMIQFGRISMIHSL